ncbi:two-component system sensor histidine kinase RppB [Pseudanabaena sp. PCC 6802]|uniref:two-component system sensor histidine kinase RppB n=1 Tax=Pseudanabaena sp. PCC 6802 TaxID=118173 RepID=UPI000369EDD5|nr:two-component system sensor histidine kinase RppB [Pseudanabaena sp. PCC 6802]
MNQNHLFTSTRWRLAGSYVAVMGLILSACSIALYQMVRHAHLQSQDRELEVFSGVLHDSLEPILKQPGQLESSVQRVLPNLCVLDPKTQETCDRKPASKPERHVLGVIQEDRYYARFWDRSGRAVAVAGNPPQGISNTLDTTTWQTLQADNGDRYHQISILLKNNRGQPWGYMQIGHSLRASDRYLATLQLTLVLGLPIAMLLVGIASWWLAGVAMRPVYHSYRQIQQFTADAAHELRTPIAVIIAAVELALSTSASNETGLDTLRTVERQSMRLSQLVQDLLLLSRLDRQDRQSLAIKFQPCCLNDLIGDLVEELMDIAIAAKISLEQDIQVDYPLSVLGNEERLYRLVANLITNAIQYTPPEEKVTVILKHDDCYAVIQVQDTGIGIAPQDQSHIFDRFYRVSSDRSRTTGGAGLGLAIAKAIAQAHQGSIQIQSELGKGSIFTVKLPRASDRFSPKSATSLYSRRQIC